MLSVLHSFGYLFSRQRDPEREVQEVVLTLDERHVLNGPGFALDIGGSTAKVAYRSKQDYTDGKPLFQQEKGKGRVRLALFSREDIDAMIQFIRTQCDIKWPGNEPIDVYSTGIGANFLKVQLEKSLNIRLRNLTEFESLVASILYISKHNASADLFLDFHPEGVAEAQRMMGLYAEMAMKMASKGGGSPLNKLNEKEESSKKQSTSGQPGKSGIFPCIIAMIGSGFSLTLVSEDGQFTFLDGSYRGGRCFMGFGNLLTGVQSYDDVMRLAARGKHGIVDQQGKDLRQAEAESDIYSHFANEILVFSFGKGSTAPRGHFKKEDILASLLFITCYDFVQQAYFVARKHNINKVYFCGNFFAADVAQKYLSLFCVLKELFLSANPDEQVKFKMLKHSGYFSALGAYLEYSMKNYM